MYEVVYADEEDLLEDVHPCEDQYLLLGGPNNLEDDTSLSCPTQDEDTEISNGDICFSFLGDDELTQ